MSSVELLVDCSLGVNIPKRFATNFNFECVDGEGWHGVTKAQIGILKDADHDDYWDVWHDVLNSAFYIDKDGNKWYLYQDGDLFALCYDTMTKEEKRNFDFTD